MLMRARKGNQIAWNRTTEVHSRKGQRILLALDAITLDPELQPRAEIDQAAVSEYAAMLANGAEFPPLVVFEQEQRYLLSDGYHRWHAYKALAYDILEVELKQGGRESALLWSFSANAKHGKPRQAADYDRAYRLAVGRDLVDAEDSIGVARVLKCNLFWAKRLTQTAKDVLDRKDRVPILDEQSRGRQQSFGHRVGQRRRERGLSRTKLAEVMGVSRPTVSRWELDMNRPSADTLLALALALETSVDWLVNGLAKAGPEEEALELLRGLPPNIQELALVTLRRLSEAQKSDRTTGPAAPFLDERSPATAASGVPIGPSPATAPLSEPPSGKGRPSASIQAGGSGRLGG